MTENNTTEHSELDWLKTPDSSEEKNDSNLDWVEDLKELNKDLEERILEANKDKTLVKWNKLLPDLMGTDILMVGQFGGEDANGQRQLNILMMQKDGHTVVPFFTSPSRIAVLKTSENSQFDVMKVNTVRFFQSIAGKPCVLNPMSDYVRIFSPFDMRVLAAENIDKAPPLPVPENA